MATNPAKGMDTRIVYGAVCSYWGSIYSIAVHPGTGLPVCPHCHRPLCEMDNEQEWMDNAKKHEDGGNPGYLSFILWLKERRCYRTVAEARTDYLAIIALNN